MQSASAKHQRSEQIAHPDDTAATFDALPNELLLGIYDNVAEFEDVLALSQTCWRMHALLQNTDSLWAKGFYQLWPNSIAALLERQSQSLSIHPAVQYVSTFADSHRARAILKLGPSGCDRTWRQVVQSCMCFLFFFFFALFFLFSLLLYFFFPLLDRQAGGGGEGEGEEPPHLLTHSFMHISSFRGRSMAARLPLRVRPVAEIPHHRRRSRFRAGTTHPTSPPPHIHQSRTPQGRTVIVVDERGEVSEFETVGGSKLRSRPLVAAATPLASASVGTGAEFVAGIDADNVLAVWRLPREGGVRALWSTVLSCPAGARTHLVGGWLCLATDTEARLLDRDSGRLVASLPHDPVDPADIRFAVFPREGGGESVRWAIHRFGVGAIVVRFGADGQPSPPRKPGRPFSCAFGVPGGDGGWRFASPCGTYAVEAHGWGACAFAPDGALLLVSARSSMRVEIPEGGTSYAFVSPPASERAGCDRVLHPAGLTSEGMLRIGPPASGRARRLAKPHGAGFVLGDASSRGSVALVEHVSGGSALHLIDLRGIPEDGVILRSDGDLALWKDAARWALCMPRAFLDRMGGPSHIADAQRNLRDALRFACDASRAPASTLSEALDRLAALHALSGEFASPDALPAGVTEPPLGSTISAVRKAVAPGSPAVASAVATACGLVVDHCAAFPSLSSLERLANKVCGGGWYPAMGALLARITAFVRFSAAQRSPGLLARMYSSHRSQRLVKVCVSFFFLFVLSSILPTLLFFSLCFVCSFSPLPLIRCRSSSDGVYAWKTTRFVWAERRTLPLLCPSTLIFSFFFVSALWSEEGKKRGANKKKYSPPPSLHRWPKS
jgi:hypothetical protein